MNKSYTSLHTHTTYSIGDSTSSPEDYIEKAKEFGMDAIAFTEHGNIYAHVKKKQLCDKAGIKYIHGIEVYVTETLEEKIRDNYHAILLAKNKDGFEELNRLYTLSTSPDHSYYSPRITFDELLGVSENIIKISACLGGIISKLDETHPRFKEMLHNFDYLEVQPHNVEDQKEYNKRLLSYGLPIIAAGDFHEVSAYKQECRSQWREGANKKYDNEDDFDLVFRNRKGMEEGFREQGVLTEDDIELALDATLHVSEQIEQYDLDYSFKFPDLYENQTQTLEDGANAELIRRVESGEIEEVLVDKYKERVALELEAFKTLEMESFILFMAELMTWCKNTGIAYGMARGSASGSLVCYLLNVTDVDPIVWGTNFTRFINVNRVSLPDIDSDFAPEDRAKVFKYIEERFGAGFSSYITTYQKLGVKKIIEYAGKAANVSLDEIAEIKRGYAALEKKKQRIEKSFDDGVLEKEDFELSIANMDAEIDTYLSKFDDIFYYYQGLKGTVSAVGYHPAGMIGSPIDIRSRLGLRYHSNNNGWVSSVDMKQVDGLNYVKYDILGLKTIQVLKHAFNAIGQKMPSSASFDWEDEAVFKSISDYNVGLFQFESSSAWEYLKKFECKSVRDIALVSAVIRPSCASFRDRLIGREDNINPDKRIDEILKDSYGYLVYQEQQISFLQKLCGFSEGQADVVRRAIGKKDPVLLAEWLPQIEAGFISCSNKNEVEAKEDCTQFMQVFLDAVNYSFSYNHAIAYSMITYLTAYMRHYHPKEFIAAYLNNAASDDDLIAGKELAGIYGIKIHTPMFGRSKGEYTVDGDSIYRGVKSVLACSNNAAIALMEVFNESDGLSVSDILLMCSEKKGVNSRMLKNLIKIGFFRRYGSIKKIDRLYQAFEKYGKRKTLKKEGITRVMKKIVDKALDDEVDKFSESAKQYKIDSMYIMREIEKMLTNAEYSLEERAIFELSYLSYVSNEIAEEIDIQTVIYGPSKNGSYLFSSASGEKSWYSIDGSVKTGDVLFVSIKTQRKIVNYQVAELDRIKR